MSKYLNDIAQYSGIKEIHGSANVLVKNLVLDSRQVSEDAMFFAVKGTSIDAHQFIPKAIADGASAIVCSELPKDIQENVTYVLVDDVQQSVGYFASAFYELPSNKMTLVGVTGTNGKTTRGH